MFKANDIHNTFSSKKVRELSLRSNRLKDIMKENYEHVINSINGDSAHKFWHFVENGESMTRDDYLEIKKLYFKKALRIDPKSLGNTSVEEIARQIKFIIIKGIFSYYIVGDKPIETINYLLDYILDEKSVKVCYGVSIEGIPIGSSKDNFKITGEASIIRTNEKKAITDEEIDYNFISRIQLNGLYPSETFDILNDDVYDISCFIDDEIDKAIGKDKIVFSFLYQPQDNIDYNGLENMLAYTDVSFFQIKEVWEKFLYESKRLFDEGNYQIAFLVAFCALDSLIEFMIYCFQEYITKMKSNMEGEEKHYWQSQQDKFSNSTRRLIEEKLKQILEIIKFNSFTFEKNTIFSKVKLSLSKLESIRNKLAHGNIVVLNDEEGNEFNLEDYPEKYIKLYAKLLLSIANILSLLDGEELFKNIERAVV